MKKKKKESYSIKTRYQLINWIIVVDKIDRQIDEWLGKRRDGTWSKTTSHSLHSFIILPSYPSLVSSTFFPPKTPQGTLDEAVVGRKNRTLHVLPILSLPSTHRIASFTIFFSLPTPEPSFLICVPPRFTPSTSNRPSPHFTRLFQFPSSPFFFFFLFFLRPPREHFLWRT